MKTRLLFGLGILLLLVGGLIWKFTPATSLSTAPVAEKHVAVAPIGAAATKHDAPPAAFVPQRREVFSAAWTKDDLPPFVAFREWTDKWLTASTAERAALLDEGRRLAEARRTAMAELIRRDPKSALEHAVPMVVRQRLPAEIVALLEDRVSGRGELALEGVTPAPGEKVAESSFRATVIDGREYRAYVYGRREAYATVGSTSMVGVAVGRDFAISEEPLRVLEAGEFAGSRPLDQLCSVSGKSSPAAADTPLNVEQVTAIEYAGKVQIVCEPAHINRVSAHLLLGETSPRIAGDNQPGTSGVFNRPAQAWTHGTKKVLVIRVDFSDFPGTPVYPTGSVPITDDFVVNLFNNAGGIADFYTQGSYGKTALSIAPAVSGDSPDVTPVYRMPSTGASYATTGNNTSLHTDAQALATADGYNLANYDRIGVVFPRLSGVPGTQITYGGLGDIEGKKFWINSWFDFRVVAHEIGHNYGLPHANLWKVTDGNPISPTGTSEEYGDPFDVMGLNGDLSLHFSHWNKSLLHWIPDTAVTTIQSSGTYRVYRFDAQAANLANARALKIVRDSVRDYWIGYRRATTNNSLNNGAYILWGYNTSQQGDLLDLTTPGNSANDAALALGATFTDASNGITITPLAQGGSGAEEYLDVQVALTAKVGLTAASTTVGEREGSVNLTVSRTRNSSGSVSVNYATASGTATSGSDFTATSGTLTWADGDTADKSISIPIAADAVAETTENFTVTLTSPVNAALGTDSATVTIVDAGVRDPAFFANFINNQVRQMLLLPDGSLVLAGDFTQVQTIDFDLYPRGGLTKIDADGTLDVNFATGGGVSGGIIRDMVMQPDGKIIIAGSFSSLHGVAQNRIARLNADGSLDSSFNIGTGPDNIIYAIILQPDGKIVLGGSFTTYNGTARAALARINSDGSLDTTFVGPTFATGTKRVEAMAMQPDGKIVVGGSFYFSGESSFKSGLCRITSTGARDTTFTGVVAGAHTSASTSSLTAVTSITLQPDGKIWIGGTFSAFNTVVRNRFARLNSDGSMDTAVDPALVNSGGSVSVNALVYLPNGHVFVGGAITSAQSTAVAGYALFDSAGTVDSGFAAKGGLVGATSVVHDVVPLPSGRLVMGCTYDNFQDSADGRPVWQIAGPLSGTAGTVQLSSASAAGTEGNSVQLSVTRSGSGVGALTVGYSTVAGTAGTADFTSTSGTLTWANGDVAAKTITVPLASDALTETGETFTVNLGAPLVGGVILGANRQTTVTVNDPLTGYAAFNAANFTAGELANVAISGPNADPDGDGLSNLVEYALGLNPKSVNSSGLPAATASGSDWVFTYTRPSSTTDVTYSVEFSSNLTSWGTGSLSSHTMISSASGTETWQARVPQSVSPTAFFHLKVVR